MNRANEFETLAAMNDAVGCHEEAKAFRGRAEAAAIDAAFETRRPKRNFFFHANWMTVEEFCWMVAYVQAKMALRGKP